MPNPVRSLIISWRSIGLSLLLSVLVGLSAAAVPLDRLVEAAIGRFAWRPVSGDIVVVAIDERTLDNSPKSSFSLTQHAQVVDAVNAAGARRLFIDFLYNRREADS
ncbi:CHASE2 domain-containing protein, partial [Sphingopyxis granuli]